MLSRRVGVQEPSSRGKKDNCIANNLGQQEQSVSPRTTHRCGGGGCSAAGAGCAGCLHSDLGGSHLSIRSNGGGVKGRDRVLSTERPHTD